MPKLRVGLLFGGRSVEHEVSIASATSIFEALDPTRYDVTLIAVDPEGRWHLGAGALPLEATVKGREVTLPAVAGASALVGTDGKGVGPAGQLDVVLPIVHGTGGEDGCLQGLLELADVAYVGAGVLGSALQMDKEVSKRLLRVADLPVVPWVALRSDEMRADAERAARRALDALELPVFVKPAALGSSVGITRVAAEGELAPALREAARYGSKLLVERALDAREIEVAILGDHPCEASVPGEIRTRREFYDYQAKYVDEDTELIVPAPLSESETETVRRLAIEAVEALEGEGLARVDFLLERATGHFYVNEVNSLPGFTDGSMYPRLWRASGLSYPALLDRLIELALERQRRKSQIETTYRAGPR